MKPTRSCEAYIDGASHGNPGPAGIGVVFVDGTASPLHEFSKPVGQTTNNVAEYLALLYALQEGLRQGITALTIKTDSELLARQIAGRYKVREPQLRLLYDLASHLMTAYSRCEVQHVPRTQNKAADRLAGRAASKNL